MVSLRLETCGCQYSELLARLPIFPSISTISAKASPFDVTNSRPSWARCSSDADRS